MMMTKASDGCKLRIKMKWELISTINDANAKDILEKQTVVIKQNK